MKDNREFEKSSMVLFILMMGANVCNYLFQIVMGNMMTVEDYGTVNTVMGIVGVLSVPTTIVTMISARYIAMGEAEEAKEDIAGVLRVMFAFVGIVSGILIIVGILGAGKISDMLNLEADIYVIGTFGLAIVNLINSVSAGTLQGLKKFFPYGVQTVLVSGGKLVLSILLVYLGWRVLGVMVSVAGGILIAILYGINYIGKYIKKAIMCKGTGNIEVKEFVKYAAGTIVAQGCIIAFTNGDILLVKAYFSDEQAGIYSSSMVIGKIAMYLTTAIVAALFPMAVEKFQKGEDTIGLFKKAMFYGGGMATACAVGMVVFGKYVIGILFGARYENAIEYLPYVCMFVVPLTFLTICMNYQLAVGKAKVFAVLLFIAVVVTVGLSTVLHKDIPQLMIMCGGVLCFALVCNLLYLFFSYKYVGERDD